MIMFYNLRTTSLIFSGDVSAEEQIAREFTDYTRCQTGELICSEETWTSHGYVPSTAEYLWPKYFLIKFCIPFKHVGPFE